MFVLSCIHINHLCILYLLNVLPSENKDYYYYYYLKLNIFKIIDGRISFYCNNLDLLPPKPKFTFQHLKKGIQEFHRKFVLAPADKAANNVVVV